MGINKFCANDPNPKVLCVALDHGKTVRGQARLRANSQNFVYCLQILSQLAPISSVSLWNTILCFLTNLSSFDSLSKQPYINIFFHIHSHFNVWVCPFPLHQNSVPLPIPKVTLQYVTNKSCLACVKSEKYAFWLP